MDRRSFLAASAVAGLGIGTAGAQSDEEPIGATKNRIKQSVCLWCYRGVEIEELAKFCVKIGIKSIELVSPKDWPTLKKHGLICAMSPGGSLTEGLSHKQNHEKCLAEIRKNIDLTSEAGFPNVICFSGNRYGTDDAEGMKNCETALKQ
ncbi:MAG: twin-arginine translocation signal domain-containing protein, partial [Planctomycetes bacterium]|nr:twin-arginine translocation signal domain-containing protein [Planctomycetota bacterium]